MFLDDVSTLLPTKVDDHVIDHMSSKKSRPPLGLSMSDIVEQYIRMLHDKGQEYMLITWLLHSVLAIAGHLCFYIDIDKNILRKMWPLDLITKLCLMLYLAYITYGKIKEILVYLNIWSWLLAWNGLWACFFNNMIGYIYGYGMVMGLGIPMLYSFYMLYTILVKITCRKNSVSHIYY